MTKLRCPECDAPIEENPGRVPAAIGSGEVRLALDCRACSTHVEVVATGAINLT